MSTFLLVRHGSTDAINRVLVGRQPGCHLNDEGRRQAERLGEWLADVSLAAIYASPLERTIETARVIAQRHALDVVPLEELLEVDCGAWTGLRFEDLDPDSRWSLYNAYRTGTRIPGGELIAEVQLRVVGAMERLRERHPNAIVALVTHGDVIRAALAHYVGLHLDMLSRFEVRPASVSIVVLGDGAAPRVSGLNLTPCLPL